VDATAKEPAWFVATRDKESWPTISLISRRVVCTEPIYHRESESDRIYRISPDAIEIGLPASFVCLLRKQVLARQVDDDVFVVTMTFPYEGNCSRTCALRFQKCFTDTM